MKTILETDDEFLCDIQAPCFQALLPAEMELVRASRTQVLFRKGENLTKQDAFASYILFVMNGLAKQYLEGDGAKNFNIRIIRPGEFVGLSAVFTGNIFNYSTAALTDCQAYLIEKEAIARVAKNNGIFAFNIIKRHCEQESILVSAVQNLMYRQMNGRLAETLLYIDSLKEDIAEVFQLLSRKDIADFTGITTESAVKLLKTFEKDGLILLQDKDIKVIKHDALVEISKKG